MRRALLLTVLALGLGTPTLGVAAPPEKSASDDAAAKHTAKDRILGAMHLPLKVQALRKAGADDAAVKAGLKAARERKLEAREAADLFAVAVTSVKEHGPVDNFGAFVQTQLDAGLRGKDLAAAIRKEHEAHGKGKPDGKGKSDGKGNHGDKPGEPSADTAPADAKGPDDAKGPPDGKGPPEGKGPDAKGPDAKAGSADPGKGPDDKGPPDDNGKPAGADKGKPEDRGKPEDKGKQGDKKGAAETKGRSD